MMGCASKRVAVSKDITYLEAGAAAKITTQKLDVYAPLKPAEPGDVFIFLHGGSWNKGKKSLYRFLGKRLARKDIVAVIPDYPLSPAANYNDMTLAVAKSVKWIKTNIKNYGGNPGRIFVAGHSAGGHLAALVAIRNQYFDSVGIANPVKGAILIDAAGLDIYGFLQEQKFKDGNTFLRTFTADSVIWKEATPLYHLHRNMPPMLIYTGGKTYYNIKNSNEKFVSALKTYVPVPDYHVMKGKRHIPMIFQLYRSKNPMYAEMITFMRAQK